MASNVSTLAVPGLNLVDTNAFQYGPKGEMAPEIALREQALNRRRQLANLLIQRGLQQPQGQMTGRFFVAPHWSQNLAQLAQVAAGVFGNYQADKEQSALAEQDRNLVAEAIQAYKERTGPQSVQQTIQGPGAPVIRDMGREVVDQTNTAGPMSVPPDSRRGFLEKQEPFYSEGPQPTMTVQQPAAETDRRQALIDLLANPHPTVQRLGAFLAKQEAEQAEKATQREFLSQEKALDRENRLAVAEGQLNQAMMMGLITKDQKDQLLAIQKQAEQDRAAHNKATEEIQRRQLALEQQKVGIAKTPPGYRQTPEGNLEAIPGGPADTKLQGVLNQDTAMLQNSTSSMDRLATAANEILNHPGLAGITGVRGKVPDIPGTDAANARALLNTLKSQIGFSVLQEMRNNSKTGGALGAISDAEGKRLENNLAALDTTQSLDQFKAQLQAIIDYANGAKDRLRDAYNMKHKGGQPIPMNPSTQRPAIGTVEGGYRFKGGDPAKPESWEKVN